MAESRRRTLAASGTSNIGSGIPVPSSAVRSQASLRQSLAGQQQSNNMAIGPGAIANTGNNNLHGSNAGRQSIAPSRNNHNSRMSLAYHLGSSQEQAPVSSQGSQLFSQGHGGPPQREPPMTASRSNNMYHSIGGMMASTMSVGRQGVLRSSTVPQQQPQQPPQPYAPPRSVVSNSRTSKRNGLTPVRLLPTARGEAQSIVEAR